MSTQEPAPPQPKQLDTPDRGPFVLKTLLEDVPLSADGDEDDIVINCVEYFDGNLYVGTSASEILHFVQIPSDPSDKDDSPTYILASRLAPAFSEKGVFERPGVQQILLLPASNKACVLCNSTVTFYTLPELSPAFGNQKVPSCNWIGGLDLNRSEIDLKFDGDVQPVVTLLSTKKRIQSVRIGEEPPRVIKSIDFAGCVLTIRRDNYACVADTHSYSLLDVDRQQKINLFPISSLDTTPTGPIGGRPEDVSGDITGRSQRSTSSAALSSPSSEDRNHGRSTSLGTFMGHHRKKSSDRLGRNTPDLFRDSSPVPAKSPNGRSRREGSPDKPLPAPPGPSDSILKRGSMIVTSGPLRPHIISPSPQEFLLVTGTGATDPGVGMFVNLEGEVTRSTLEFGRYPEAVVSDGRGVDVDLSPGNAEEAEDGYVLAVISKDTDDKTQYGLEIQRWDLDAGESASEKSWLDVPDSITEAGRSKVGVRSVTEAAQFSFDEVVQKLRIARFRPFPPPSFPPRSSSKPSNTSEHNKHQSSTYMKSEDDEERAEEELLFAKRLGRGQSRIVVWSGNKIWLAARNPLVLRLEAQMGNGAYDEALMNPKAGIITMSQVINSIRGREARTEIEFLSLGYIRQRAGLLLLTDLISRDSTSNDAEYNAAQEAILEGALDPRVVVALSPRLRGEVVEGKAGIWIPAGIRDVAERFLAHPISDAESWDDRPHVLQFYRRFLGACRKQKGFGSTTDETEKFNTVDAALLLVLLQLDKDSPTGFGKRGSSRSELHDVVDHGVECFDRAVDILEDHKRLYVLSRLYQSRKLAGEVLATWRRIVEGEMDVGGEFTDGEQRVRDYLTIIRNAKLVEEYGVWLASRNPKLGVQVFADERSRVAFEPTNVVEILRSGAPGAVKEYLEYLVFAKGMNEYGTELIAYYLDIVLIELESSAEARDVLSLGYKTYRALSSPKPTYRQFIAENGIDADWWRARLRLLQLLGGTPEVGARRGSTADAAAADYDLPSILGRIEPYRDLLVPELIILDGRQGRHAQALRLLVHGLGDYDTAINYCLAGGSSIYHPISGTLLSSNKSVRSVNTNGEDSQHHLFDTLLSLFLALPDQQNCIDQTSNLLSRFGSYFDILDVLNRVPEGWGVAVIDTFLISRCREIVTERNETMIVRALRGSENIQVAEEFIDRVDKLGFTIEGVE